MSVPSSSTAIEQLKRASDGLLWMSESDYPFEVFLWQGQAPLTTEGLLEHIGKPPDATVEVVELDDFFQPATEDLDWYGPEEKETAMRYRQFVETIRKLLPGTRVYRVGAVEVDVLIVGQVRMIWLD